MFIWQLFSTLVIKGLKPLCHICQMTFMHVFNPNNVIQTHSIFVKVQYNNCSLVNMYQDSFSSKYKMEDYYNCK